MGLIDWNLIGHPFGLGSLFGGLGENLQKFRAEDEERRRFEANQQLQRDQLAANENHWQADAAARAAAAQASAAQHREAMDLQRQRFGYEQEKDALPAIEKAKPMLRDGNLAGAHGLLGPLGVKLFDQPSNFTPPTEQDKQTWSGLKTGLGPFGLGSLFGDLQEQAPPPKVGGFELPSGRRVEYDPEADRQGIERAANERAGQVQQRISSDTPHAREVQTYVQNLVRNGTPFDEATEKGMAYAQHLQGEDAAERRAYIAQAGATERAKNGVGQRRLGDDPLGIKDLAGNRVGEAQSLGEAEKLRAAQPATVSLGGALDRLKAFYAKEGTIQVPFFEAGARKELEGIVSEAAGYLTRMYESGVLNDGEYKRYGSMLTAEPQQSTESALANIERIKQAIATAYTNKVNGQRMDTGSSPAGSSRAPMRSAPSPGVVDFLDEAEKGMR